MFPKIQSGLFSPLSRTGKQSGEVHLVIIRVNNWLSKKGRTFFYEYRNFREKNIDVKLP